MHRTSTPQALCLGYHEWGIPSHGMCLEHCARGIPSQGLSLWVYHARWGAGICWPCCTIHSAASSTWGSISPSWGRGELCPAVPLAAGLLAPALGWWEGWVPLCQRARGCVPLVPAQRAVEE